MKKGIVSLLLVGAAMRLAMLAGAGDAVSEWAREISSDGSLRTATLSLELGSKPDSPKISDEQEQSEQELTDNSVPESPETVQELVSTMQVKVTPTPEKQEESEPAQQTVQEEPKPEMSRFARLRERNALKMEMKRAIHEENFERAAELRDQLRQMEQAEP